MAFPIFDKLGGQEAAVALIASARGKTPTRYVLDKWRSKRAIPDMAAVPLIMECQRRGVVTTEADLRWQDAREAAE